MDIKSDFVSVERDEFDRLTTIQHLRHCRYRSGKNEITFSWRRNIRPASDRMILDVEIKTSRPGGWLPSQLTLLVDGRRIELKYLTGKSSEFRGGASSKSVCFSSSHLKRFFAACVMPKY